MMFGKLSKNSEINRILMISLSNIGDVVLTFPVFDALHHIFPQACISVVIGPKAASLLRGNPHIEHLCIYDKHIGFLEKLSWWKGLRQIPFDLVVDLRNSMLPYLLDVKHIGPLGDLEHSGIHMKRKHLQKLSRVLGGDIPVNVPKKALFISKDEQEHAQMFLGEGPGDYIVIAAGAADERKRWPAENFNAVIEYFLARKLKIVLLGDERDARECRSLRRDQGIDLMGKISLMECSALIRNAQVFLGNDSGLMHIASYLDIPTVALFGPTSPELYGPWGSRGSFLQGKENLAEISVSVVNATLDTLLSKK